MELVLLIQVHVEVIHNPSLGFFVPNQSTKLAGRACQQILSCQFLISIWFLVFTDFVIMKIRIFFMIVSVKKCLNYPKVW